MKLEPAHARERQRPEVDASTPGTENGVTPRILLACGDADRCEHVRRLLAGLYHVTTAANGPAALATAVDQAPDLVMADAGGGVAAAGLDGADLLRALRTDPRTAAIPTIALAPTDEQGQVRAWECGADDVIVEPFSARELLARVKSQLHLSRARREAIIVEEALRDSERRYRQLVTGLPVAVYTCDRDGRLQLYNDAAVELWGQAPPLGTTWWCGAHRIFSPDGAPLPADQCPMALAIREGRAIRGAEIIIERPDGIRRHVQVHPTPIRDASGEVVGAINMLIDVTERKEAEAAQSLLAAIVESSEDAIVSKTLDGLITSWNAGAEQMFGYAASEAVGQPITMLIPPERHDEEREILARLRRGERIEHIETVRITKDGTKFDASLTVSPLRDSDGRIIGASKIARNVSERKRAEEELAATKDNLASQVKGLARLHDLAMHLAGTPALEPALDAILAALVEIHEADFGVLSIYDPATDRLIPAASRGFDDGVLAMLADLPPASDAGATAAAFATRKRAVVEDIETDPRFNSLREPARLAGFRAAHSTPILTRSKEILGVLSVHFRERRQPTRLERQLANLCARYAAETIDAARSGQALRKSEERFSRFMRHLPGLAWIKDAEGRYVYANDAAERAFGAPRSTLYGRTDGEVFSPETARQFRANDQRALAGESGLEAIETLAQEDGVHHSLVSKFPIPGPDGAPAMIGGIAIDMTERVKAEQALRDSEERFRSVTMNAPVAIFIKDLEGRYTLCNPLASEALGRPRGAVGLTDHDLLDAASADVLRAHDQQVVAAGHVIEYEESVTRPGFDRDYLAVKFPLRDAEGRAVGVCGVSVDVTERKRAQRALQESEQRLGLATRAGKLGVWDWDVANDRISWSESLYAIHGVGPAWFAENVGGFAALVYPEDRERVAAAIQLALKSDAPYELEFRALRPDGEIVWLFTNAVVLRENGTPVRMLGATMDITESKRGEAALRVSEERFRTLASHAPVGIFQSDANGDNVFVNESWCAMAGISAEQARGPGWLDALHPDDRERVAAGWSDAVRNKSDSNAEFRFLRPDGVVTWLQGNAVPLVNDRDESIGYIGTVSDITARKKAEEALRNSERMYRAIGESIDYGVWVCDGEGRLIYASESFLNLLGMTQDEVTAFGWTDALHPDDVEQTLVAWKECVRTGEPWDVEHRFRALDGTWRPILARGVPVRDDSGDIIAWAGINLDISQLKKVENELRESEARFRSMADNAPVLIWVNGIGGCQYVNKEYLKFTGASTDAIVGMGFINFVHPDDAKAYMATYQLAFDRQGPFEAQCRYRRSDGLYRWISSSAAPRFRADGTFLGYVGCSVDVTDIKQSEEALKEADRRKDDFLAMLGHELRNPLAGIVSGAQVLSMLDLAEEATEMQAVIARQASHMSQIVDDLLDVSRITRGKLTLRRHHVELRRLMREAVADYQRGRPMDQCELQCTLPAADAWVWGDATRLTQAISNVLHNSYKFSDGPNVISVEMTVDAQRRQATIAVRDRGMGMTAETLDQLFIPFNQADTSLERSRGGLGLGLALAKGLVALHNGTIAAASEGLGRGSTFAITLPCVAPPPAELALEPEAPRVSRRVLIIDDRRDAVLPLQRLLEKAGHTVDSASDGPSGIAKAIDTQPEVVLCDIGLDGDMNGYQVARIIRSTPSIAGVYLAAVTGYSQEEDRRMAKESGFDFHVKKPPDQQELNDLLARLPRF